MILASFELRTCALRARLQSIHAGCARRVGQALAATFLAVVALASPAALATVTVNKQFDLSCVGCHLTGFRLPGGSEVVENAGLLAPIDAATLAAVPAQYRPASGDWTGIAARSTVMVYNPTLIAADQLPRLMSELVWTMEDPVAREEMTRLLTSGKTALLENFVSNKTRRKFKAFLAYDKKEGKVIFEFEPRAGKAPPAKKAAAKKTAKA